MALFRSYAEVQVQSDFSHAQDLLEGTRCFLCGGQLGGPAGLGFPVIYWRGFGGDMHLHASCGADITFRIAQDVQTLKHELSLHLAFESDELAPGGLRSAGSGERS